MPRGLKLLLVTIFLLLVLSSCSTLPQTTLFPTIPIAIYTPTPTSPSIAATVTSTPLPLAPTPPLISLHMLDAHAGWAWTTTGRLLRTTDGGRTWIDRTPEGYQQTDAGFFLDAQTSWLPVYLTADNRFGLLHTTDGGASWLEYPQSPSSGLHFTDNLTGWAVSGDVGAGNVYFSLSQTSDGGKTWAPIPVKPQDAEPGLPPGTIHLCNICNDAFYYDPSRLIIVYGDLGSMQPGGSVRMQVSFDLGSTWQAHNLPLPQGESDALVAPNQPLFFDPQVGILPIHLLKMDAQGAYTEQKLAIYATYDGGVSWTLLPTILDDVYPFASIQTDFSQDVYVVCGNALCASHDRARTWQPVSSNLDFTTTDKRAVSAIDFVSGTTGWVLLMEGDTTSLYSTEDGGSHWILLSPMLLTAAPPEITVDTSIPTPTPVPTATLEPTPTPDVVYDPQAQANRITFPLYTTWVQIGGVSAANGDVRYVLSAMQDQVMSVALLQGPPLTVEVVGADQKPLTDATNPQPYWRGSLPSSQDYFITVKSPIEAQFTLRIAINPLGKPVQDFALYNDQYKVALSYSDEFAPTSWQLPFNSKGSLLATLYFIDPSFYYPTTNLVEAGIGLAATADPGIVATCIQPAQQGETITGQVTIDSYTFTRSEFTGAAAGNRYEQIFYRTVWQGQCFEVIFLIHSAEIGNYPAGTVVEFDHAALLAKFEQVLDSFVAK